MEQVCNYNRADEHPSATGRQSRNYRVGGENAANTCCGWPSIHGTGSPAQASRMKNDCSRERVNPTAAALLRTRSRLVVPSTGMIRAGCARIQAGATYSTVAPPNSLPISPSARRTRRACSSSSFSSRPTSKGDHAIGEMQILNGHVQEAVARLHLQPIGPLMVFSISASSPIEAARAFLISR